MYDVTEPTTVAARRADVLRARAAAWRPPVALQREVPVPNPVADNARTASMFTRGSTVQSTMEFLEQLVATGEIETILGRLSAADRAVIGTVGPTDEIPYRVAMALWRSVDETLGRSDAAWVERAGYWAIEQTGMRLYAGLIRRPSPIEFLSQHTSLFHLYYRPGDMVLAEESPGRAVTRLVGFEPGDRLFCRRLAGGWAAALTIAGGREVAAEHTRCSVEGDLFCEWELRWK